MNKDVNQARKPIKKTFEIKEINTLDDQNSNLDRRVSRTSSSPVNITGSEKRKFTFIGLSSGAGTTTIALAFAEYMSALNMPKRKSMLNKSMLNKSILQRKEPTSHTLPVAFIEINDENKSLRGMTYDRVGIDKRFVGREFQSYYHLINEGRAVRGECNPDSGINWALRIPGEEFMRTEITNIIRLSENVQGLNTIIDISGNYGSCLTDDERMDELKTILCDSDIIFVIVDPLPSALMADRRKFSLFKGLEASGQPVCWIINKLNQGVNTKELRNYLQRRDYFSLPYFDAKEVYSAEYNCLTILSMPTSSEILQKCFKNIAELHKFNMVL